MSDPSSAPGRASEDVVALLQIQVGELREQRDRLQECLDSVSDNLRRAERALRALSPDNLTGGP